ncbi:hypothetical protein SELMODRAFT_424070 [Selaginella moellendorffii]|uniref:ATPase domain-containing protein n=1 Tax=Selaginella moellendorffii TaxID=88036 RepID=D8SNQ0_SELML|nr:hypothetical protein SELMODRAFT_424070 [Selaginella moellendorffii]
MEIAKVDKLLQPSVFGDAGKVVTILGPKDSGKTAVIREFRRRQSLGLVSGVSSYIHLRQSYNLSPANFANTLWTSLGQSLGQKIDADANMKTLKHQIGCKSWGIDIDDKLFKVTTPQRTALHSRERADAMAMVFEALPHYCMDVVRDFLNGYTGGFPTAFIDEANVLQYWHSREMDELMRQIVSGIDHMLDVQGHRTRSVTIGNFPKDESLAFVGQQAGPERLAKVQVLWDEVFDHIEFCEQD